MEKQRLKYIAAYVIPVVVVLSIAIGGYYSFGAILFIFGFIPVLELFLKPSKDNLTSIEEAVAKEDRFYDFLLYSMLPIQYAILLFFLYRINAPGLETHEKVGMTLAYGVSCGVLGINVAHELGHRSTKHEQLMSKLLLLTSLYMHFFIEHNRGHHRRVSTDKDPASSRRGEWVYAFWLRSSLGGWISAWKLEFERLKRVDAAIFSLQNEMLVFQLVQLLLVLAIFVFWGLQTLLFFLCGATVGFLLLETVNYIEHYGLRRKKRGGIYERTLPIHSWNSNHPLGRLLLFELSRHSDHHYIANRKYQLLRHFDESPQMPTGYPGMMLLSLVPPIWFWLMHWKIDQYRATKMGEALA